MEKYAVIADLESDRHQGIADASTEPEMYGTFEEVGPAIAAFDDYSPRVLDVHVYDLDTGERVPYVVRRIIQFGEVDVDVTT